MINLGSLPRISINDSLRLQQRLGEALPVIIVDLVNDWNKLSKWTFERFQSELADVPVRFRHSPSCQHPHIAPDGIAVNKLDIDGTLYEYLERLRKGDNVLLDGNLTCLRSRKGKSYISQGLSPLANDVEIPSFFDESLIETIGIWLSGAGVQTRLHYDRNGKNNFNAQIKGKKEVVLFPPDEADKLYPISITSDLHNFARVNHYSPDLEHFPKFSEARGYKDRINEGEMLYIPAYWYHGFEHVNAFNFNVNFWYDAVDLRVSPVSLRAEIATLVSLAHGHKPKGRSFTLPWSKLDEYCLSWHPKRADMDEIGEKD